MNSWKAIDHQRGDGGDFGFFRNREWLTKQRTAYGDYYSDLQNTIAIANAQPEHHDEGDERKVIWERGSQYVHDSSGPPTAIARSITDSFVYTSSEMTDLYNSDYEGVNDVAHASRSIIWLEPDHIVVYDRVETKADNGPIQFFLQVPGEPAIDGHRATVETKDQQLIATTLLPGNAKVASDRLADVATEDPAQGEPMTHRLRVEPASPSRSVRFLHVLQGADKGAAGDTATLLSSTGTPFAAVAIAGSAVLFPVDLGGSFDQVTVEVPGDVHRVLVTGLDAGGGYDVTVAGNTVTVARGGAVQADAGGVLAIPI
jgi:hypothetical protein